MEERRRGLGGAWFVGAARGAAGWAAGLLALAGCVAPGGPPDAAVPPADWEVVCAWLREQADGLAADLGTARARLLEAAADRPDLVEHLGDRAADARPRGWGVLPEVLPATPPSAVSPTSRRYALRPLSVNFVASFRDARLLAARAARDLDDEASLEAAVADHARLRRDLDNLAAHLAYHEQWQAEVARHAAWFAERSARSPEIAAMAAALEAGEPGAEDERRRLGRAIAVFRPAAGLRLRDEGDVRVLPVTLHTDVDDAAFRRAFLDAVDEAWNVAPAARAAGLRVEVELVVHDVRELRPDDPPARGEPIDVADHLARFPEGALVMTTGAASTHAWKARSLLLGPTPVTPRTLAHEFGHLLGFDDAYLRAVEGSPDGPFGVVLVEWTGLVDDLMGNPRGGVVTEDMVRRLLDAYGG